MGRFRQSSTLAIGESRAEHFRFLRITAMLYLFVLTQFRTENRYPLFLELL